MKKLLFIIISLVMFTSVVEAAETYVDVAVTVNVGGGCSLTTQAFNDVHSGIFTNLNYVFLNDYTFQVECTQGTNYTLQFNPAGGTTLKLYRDGYGTSQWILLRMFKDDGSTDITSGGTIKTGVGTGSAENVTIKPAIRNDGASNPACSSSGGTIYSCAQGLYTRSLTIKATF